LTLSFMYMNFVRVLKRRSLNERVTVKSRRAPGALLVTG
jgi:hypothetical protein